MFFFSFFEAFFFFKTTLWFVCLVPCFSGKNIDFVGCLCYFSKVRFVKSVRFGVFRVGLVNYLHK